jgi:eukaryotic-like serine/threonine-protein kinase
MVVQHGQRIVKLLDFGVAKLLHPDPGEANLTVAGKKMGTSVSMAPEQIRSETVGPQTDVYGLGVVLFTLLTGVRPFSGDNPEETARMHLESAAPRASTLAPVPQEVDEVIARCLEKEPERRYPSTGALLSALRQALAGSAAETEQHEAIGIFVDLRVEGSSTDELDDPLFQDLTSVLDQAEAMLRQEGYAVPLQTAGGVLGIKLLPEAVPDALTARADAITFAQTLLETVKARPDAQARVQVHVSVHVDWATVRHQDGGPQIQGGAIAQTERWAVREPRGQVHSTQQVLRGLS